MVKQQVVHFDLGDARAAHNRVYHVEVREDGEWRDGGQLVVMRDMVLHDGKHIHTVDYHGPSHTLLMAGKEGDPTFRSRLDLTESALPGNFSQLVGTGKAFRSVFFPSWQADPLLAVADETGLDGAWWSSFSVAVLCQAIAELGSSIRGQMLSGDIDRDVASYNATLRSRSAHAYSTVLSRTYQPLVALLQRVNKSTVKEQFRESLLNNVLTRQLWYQAGQWTSPEWEMFNQYAKYLVLGASETEVDALIDALTAAGLPIPAPVNKQGWRTYAEELRERPAVNVDDIRDACAVPVTEVTHSPYSRNPAGLPNGNSYAGGEAGRHASTGSTASARRSSTPP